MDFCLCFPWYMNDRHLLPPAYFSTSGSPRISLVLLQVMKVFDLVTSLANAQPPMRNIFNTCHVSVHGLHEDSETQYDGLV
jgi:hypothetical protein